MGINPRDIHRVTGTSHFGKSKKSHFVQTIQSESPHGYSLKEHILHSISNKAVVHVDTNAWFKRNLAVVNKLSTMMSQLLKNAGICAEKRLSNLGARRSYLRAVRQQRFR